MLFQPKLRFAVANMGAPAGGMNAATRAFVRLMITEGYEVFAFEFGFDGLVNDQVSVVPKASNSVLNVNTKTQPQFVVIYSFKSKELKIS